MNLSKPQATFRRGLAGIREARDLATHAMRGALFETWVLGEMLKHGCHRGEAPGVNP